MALKEETDVIVLDYGKEQGLEVLFQEEVQLETDVSLFYIKSGEEEIKNYIDKTAVPEINKHIQTATGEALSQINEYVENTAKPAIQNTVDDNIMPQLTSQTAKAVTAAGDAAQSASTAVSAQNIAQIAEQNSLKYANAPINEYPDGSAAYWCKEAYCSALKASFGNIGDIKYTVRTEIPNGGAWCDGALYTQTQFPELYKMLADGKLQAVEIGVFDQQVAANGVCGYFGLDSNNQQFKVPLIKDVFIEASSNNTAPDFISAGLPNIIGTADFDAGTNTAHFSGALSSAPRKSTTENYYIFSGSNAGNYTQFSFDASKSNPVYGNSLTVQPPAIKYRAYVVLYSSAAEASEAQAAEFIQSLGAKVNTADLDNIFNSRLQVVDVLPQNPQNNVFYFIPE